MLKRIAVTVAGLGGFILSGCVAGAGYGTYSGPIYYEPAPVAVEEVVVVPRYRRYDARRFDDRRYYDRHHRRYHGYDGYRRYPRG